METSHNTNETSCKTTETKKLAQHSEISPMCCVVHYWATVAFSSERKVSQGNTIVLWKNANILQENTKFPGECNAFLSVQSGRTQHKGNAKFQ